MDTVNPSATSNDSNVSSNLSDTRLKCCCGRPACAYWEHNNRALGGLEKDLETAARLGQALLTRHESYISESQAEHDRLSSYISDLESERTSLQTANEKIVAENRSLWLRLEGLNASLATSDDEVKRLEDLLQECESEVKRLNGLVRRTEETDGRLQDIEQERQMLLKQVDESHEQSRTALIRWRESEQRVRQLEEDMLRIEHEAVLDRTRHEQMIVRLERQRSLDRELFSAEGRLKGAAALSSVNAPDASSKQVVSHFVRDILQDNATLRAGIAELRELLQTSNEEVQNLREQIVLHQPLSDSGVDEEMDKQPSLDEQMQVHQLPPLVPQQEVHVHHHFHSRAGRKEKMSLTRRPARRRAILPMHHRFQEVPSTSAPIQKLSRVVTSPATSVNMHPQSSQNRWSVQSSSTNSTILSGMSTSPRSHFDRSSSIFDRMEYGEEYSRPTSPESVGDLATTWQAHGLKIRNMPLADFQADTIEEDESTTTSDEVISPDTEATVLSTEPENSLEPARDLTPKPSITFQSVSVEAPPILEPAPKAGGLRSAEATVESLIEHSKLEIPELRQALRHRSSHESLVSISGMDIHLAKRPSPTSTLELLRGNSSHFAHSPAQARRVAAIQPIAAVTEYTAVSSSISIDDHHVKHTARRLPSGIEALSGIAVPAARIPNNSSQSAGGLGRLVGGWVRGRWGIAPAKSTADLRSVSSGHSCWSVVSDRASEQSAEAAMPAVVSPALAHVDAPSMKAVRPVPAHAQTAPAVSVSGTYTGDPLKLVFGRSPGINQPGSIPGLRAAAMNRRTPGDVQTTIIDEEGLRDSLAET